MLDRRPDRTGPVRFVPVSNRSRTDLSTTPTKIAKLTAGEELMASVTSTLSSSFSTDSASSSSLSTTPTPSSARADYNNDLKNTIANYSKLPPSPWTLKLVPYWLSGEGQQRFPLIRELALETASIPATSSSVERLFSTTGKSVSGDRGTLSSQQIESECLNSCNPAFY